MGRLTWQFNQFLQEDLILQLLGVEVKAEKVIASEESC